MFGNESKPSSSSSSPRLSRITRETRSSSLENLPGSPSGSSSLACPICGDEMINLAQLNRHLDDAHQTDFDTKDALVSWFRSAQRKVAAPLSRAAQKTTETITGLRVDNMKGNAFELNPSPATGSPNGAVTPNVASPGGDQEAMVTRGHWQREGPNDKCGITGCGKPLGLRNGNHHCRKCGHLYCDVHASYQMKLSPSALSDPINGIWCRVCEKCYMERDGYRDSIGVSRNKTQAFIRLRKNRINNLHLEANKLEKRLEKLSILHAEEGTGASKASKRSSFYGGAGAVKRSMEQNVVAWEDDKSVTACPLCSKPFGSLTNRRHHCRLCGRVVCGKASCSVMIPLQVTYEEERHSIVAQIRVCLDCNRIVARRREKKQDTANSSQIVRLYGSITKYKALVDEILPKFNNLLMSMAGRATVEYDDRDYQMANRYRKNLMEYFAELDKLSKQIKLLPASTTTTTRLHQNIVLGVLHYLQSHMFTLQLMPKVSTKPAVDPTEDVATVKLDPELGILEEQYRQVEGFLQDALKRRRLEDASALKESLEELGREIEARRRGMS